LIRWIGFEPHHVLSRSVVGALGNPLSSLGGCKETLATIKVFEPCL
jgi:hypothetical protein